jgi:hypothetical protein
MTNKKTQKARDNSNLTQIEQVIVGIDEKRVREVVDEKLDVALKEFTSEAFDVAKGRSEEFNSSLIKRMVNEQALSAFTDPSFQILLIEAQKTAASSERKHDYDLLSELMVHRFKKGSDRVVRAGITRAVEIVDQISNEALLAITVYHSLSYFTPVAGNLNKGLEILDNLFGKIIYDTLPTNDEWLDHLDILDAVRISSFGSTKLLEDYWYELFDGYIKKGIKEESEEYSKTKMILSGAQLNEKCLMKNSFDENYLKFEVLNKAGILNLSMINLGQRRPINEKERIALEKVYDLYDGVKMQKEDFIKEIEKYQNLKKLREWWNKLKDKSIKITSVGRVIAHSNAQRIDATLPSLN